MNHPISYLVSVKWHGCAEIVVYGRCESGSFHLQHCCYSDSGLLLSMPASFALISPFSWRSRDLNSSLTATGLASSPARGCQHQVQRGCNLSQCEIAKGVG